MNAIRNSIHAKLFGSMNVTSSMLYKTVKSTIPRYSLLRLANVGAEASDSRNYSEHEAQQRDRDANESKLQQDIHVAAMRIAH